jgi:hypothetical protein
MVMVAELRHGDIMKQFQIFARFPLNFLMALLSRLLMHAHKFKDTMGIFNLSVSFFINSLVFFLSILSPGQGCALYI